MRMETLPQKSMIRKHSSDGIGYSVVELNGISHVFAAAVPRTGGTLHEQADDALRTIEAVIHEEGARGSIVKQAVFMRESSQLDACRQIMRRFYGDQMPATTYISQPPCCRKLVAMEALGVGHGTQEVEIERISEQLVITRHSGVRWIHCDQVVPKTSAGGVYQRSLSAFEQMAQMLRSQGVGFDRVIRTWLYLGGIIGMDGQTQRYHELNRARTDYYRDIEFTAGRTGPGLQQAAYPASTGIGSENHDVVMSCIAVEADPEQLVLIPLENPSQTSAFEYEAKYGRESPKFARAMALTTGRCSTIFVSGTASITNSETRWIDDVRSQTHQTLDNIQALISEANFLRHGWPGLGAGLEDLAFVRVYIKHQRDCAKVQAVCEARLGELPTIYAVADVCRPELLVEIEGIAFSSASVR